jgi:hypothetical protein
MSKPQPALKPTDPATLLVGGLAAAALAWLLISNLYQDLPPMIWPPVVVIAGLAAFEALVAQNLWARIHQRGRAIAGRRGPGGGPEPVDPLTVARFAVLAKSSSLAGSIFAGFYAGYLPWLLVESGRLPGAAADLPPTVGGLLASVALLLVALWLERACRIPEPPEEPERPETDSP